MPNKDLQYSAHVVVTLTGNWFLEGRLRESAIERSVNSWDVALIPKLCSFRSGG
jgi:hypothetical protein